MGIEPRPAPVLRVVGRDEAPASRRFDSVTRDSHLQRIRYLARAYNLRWLVDQATFDRPGIDSLEDDELVALHRDLDRAIDCIRYDVCFIEAGLLRHQGDS